MVNSVAETKGRHTKGGEFMLLKKMNWQYQLLSL